MAGYVIKITLEDTHPPVWRRVVIPEKITFLDLHEVIQVLFGWEDEHLHDFSIPSKYICISDDNEGFGKYHYPETMTIVDQLLLNNRWIRYTYDFGDNWRHKIAYEKTDEEYKLRHAVVLKAKGNNFEEDSGGVFGYEDNQQMEFNTEEVNQRLATMNFEVSESMTMVEDELNQMYLEEQMGKIWNEFIRQIGKQAGNKKQTVTASKMKKKIEEWRCFAKKWDNERSQVAGCNQNKKANYEQLSFAFLGEESVKEQPITKYQLSIEKGNRSIEENLKELDMTTAKDYCKYLQIPISEASTRNQMTAAIAQDLHDNPEHILIAFFQNEFVELCQWMKKPLGQVVAKSICIDSLLKAVSLGMIDVKYEYEGTKVIAKLSFATDLYEIIHPFRGRVLDHFYHRLQDISGKIEEFIAVYGVLELDKFYQLFCKTYEETLSQIEFNRYIYWYARLNNLVQTATSPEGISYVASVELDMVRVVSDMNKYAADVDYIEFTRKEINEITRYDGGEQIWIRDIYLLLVNQLKLSEEVVGSLLQKMYVSILNGAPIAEVFNLLYHEIKVVQVEINCELWSLVLQLMLQQKLPMLKGRSRLEYGLEKKISAWTYGMEKQSFRLKIVHMYQFPIEIQEQMVEVLHYMNRDAMRQLYVYMEDNSVKSEEFIYLLAKAHIYGCELTKASKLIEKLEQGSTWAMSVAKLLRNELENCGDVIDEDEFDY